MSVKKEVQGDLSYNKIYVSLGEEGWLEQIFRDEMWMDDQGSTGDENLQVVIVPSGWT